MVGMDGIRCSLLALSTLYVCDDEAFGERYEVMLRIHNKKNSAPWGRVFFVPYTLYCILCVMYSMLCAVCSEYLSPYCTMH